MSKYHKKMNELKCNCGGTITVSELCNVIDEVSDDSKYKFAVTCELECDCCKEPSPTDFKSPIHCIEYHMNHLSMCCEHSGLTIKDFIKCRYGI